MVRKKIDGILLLDKPLHMTSNGALQRVKWLFAAKKAGHTGSLDPLATGMLPLCFGEATKFSQYLLDSDKCYQVTAQLGVKTTTADAEGDVVTVRPFSHMTREAILALLPKFTGVLQQIPPMYSALKVNGKHLYELARNGVEIPREPRTVTIHVLKLIDFEGDKLKLEVHCSKGTYIRTLVEDMGEELGCGAHVSALRRSVVFPYQESKMLTLETIEALHQAHGADYLTQFLLPVETSVQSFPAIQLPHSAAFYIRMGQPVMTPNLPPQGWVRIFSKNDQFMGVGEILEDGRVAPRRLIGG
jgi:tRNA pseudouridine55 synthase